MRPRRQRSDGSAINGTSSLASGPGEGACCPLPGVGNARIGGRDEAADRSVAAADARRRCPGAAQPRRLVARFGRGGATDLGGLSTNGDHISPEEPFPSPHQVRKELAPRGYALTERLCAYPQYLDPEWMEQGVLDVVKLKYWSFIPRRGSGRRRRTRRLRRSRHARSRRAAAARSSREEELTALFSETRPEVIEEMRAAADELRAELAGETRDLRRQPEHQLHQRLRRRLRLLRLRPGQALAGRLPRRRGGLRRPGSGGDRLRRDRDLHAGRDPSRLHARGLRALAAARQGVRARDPPARVLADGDPLHVRALRQRPRLGLRVPDRVRARLDAGDGGRGARRRGPPADLAEQAAGGPLGRDHRGVAPRRACARPRR